MEFDKCDYTMVLHWGDLDLQLSFAWAHSMSLWFLLLHYSYAAFPLYLLSHLALEVSERNKRFLHFGYLTGWNLEGIGVGRFSIQLELLTYLYVLSSFATFSFFLFFSFGFWLCVDGACLVNISTQADMIGLGL